MVTDERRIRRRRTRRRIAALSLCAVLTLGVVFGLINVLLERNGVAAIVGPADAPRVLLIHGLDEPGTIWADLQPALVEAGFSVELFEYPNDQPIAASAERLQSVLLEMRSAGVERIDIVAHSMGGLVTRDALTRPGVDPDVMPAVEHFIMVGTPNHGSPLAPLQPISELREAIVRWASAFGDPRSIETIASDGNGEASIDLTPGSDFLLDLNGRPLPEGVAITIIAGQVSPVDADAFADATAALLSDDQRARLRDAAAELVNSVGDGVVPVESARLAGVDDIVIVEANHRAMLKRLALEREIMGDDGYMPPAIPIVLDRLNRDDAPD